MSLDAYDKEELKPFGTNKTTIKLGGEELMNAIINLRIELIKKKEATDIFAQERSSGNVAGIVGNIMQSFGGKDVYKTAEEKAAHLLYFMVKNHPFVDGNKRSGHLHLSGLYSKLGSNRLETLTQVSSPLSHFLLPKVIPTRKIR